LQAEKAFDYMLNESIFKYWFSTNNRINNNI
jgi:hypothetical protein